MDWLSRRLVAAIPTCRLWMLHAYQPDFAIAGGKVWPDGRQEVYLGLTHWYWKCGPFKLSDQMQIEYPKGGWGWRRLLQIMLEK